MYTVRYTSRARRQLMRLPARVATRVYEAAEQLAVNPRPPGCVNVRFAQQTYRIRVGEYRLIYEVRDQELFVAVVRVAKRDESSYRGL